MHVWRQACLTTVMTDQGVPAEQAAATAAEMAAGGSDAVAVELTVTGCTPPPAPPAGTFMSDRCCIDFAYRIDDNNASFTLSRDRDVIVECDRNVEAECVDQGRLCSTDAQLAVGAEEEEEEAVTVCEAFDEHLATTIAMCVVATLIVSGFVWRECCRQVVDEDELKRELRDAKHKINKLLQDAGVKTEDEISEAAQMQELDQLHKDRDHWQAKLDAFEAQETSKKINHNLEVLSMVALGLAMVLGLMSLVVYLTWSFIQAVDTWIIILVFSVVYLIIMGIAAFTCLEEYKEPIFQVHIILFGVAAVLGLMGLIVYGLLIFLKSADAWVIILVFTVVYFIIVGLSVRTDMLSDYKDGIFEIHMVLFGVVTAFALIGLMVYGVVKFIQSADSWVIILVFSAVYVVGVLTAAFTWLSKYKDGIFAVHLGLLGVAAIIAIVAAMVLNFDLVHWAFFCAALCGVICSAADNDKITAVFAGIGCITLGLGIYMVIVIVWFSNYCSVHSDPCYNEGECLDDGSPDEFWCECVDPYHGETCLENACPAGACSGVGACSESGGAAVCECYDGYSGEGCQYDVPYCSWGEDFCQNGGICVSKGPRGYECACSCETAEGDVCVLGNIGDHCEDECDNSWYSFDDDCPEFVGFSDTYDPDKAFPEKLPGGVLHSVDVEIVDPDAFVWRKGHTLVACVGLCCCIGALYAKKK